MSNKEHLELAQKIIFERTHKEFQDVLDKFNLLTLNISVFPNSGTDTISFKQAFKVIEDLYDTMNKLKAEGKISPEAHTQLLNQIIR